MRECASLRLRRDKRCAQSAGITSRVRPNRWLLSEEMVWSSTDDNAVADAFIRRRSVHDESDKAAAQTPFFALEESSAPLLLMSCDERFDQVWDDERHEAV